MIRKFSIKGKRVWDVIEKSDIYEDHFLQWSDYFYSSDLSLKDFKQDFLATYSDTLGYPFKEQYLNLYKGKNPFIEALMFVYLELVEDRTKLKKIVYYIINNYRDSLVLSAQYDFYSYTPIPDFLLLEYVNEIDLKSYFSPLLNLSKLEFDIYGTSVYLSQLSLCEKNFFSQDVYRDLNRYFFNSIAIGFVPSDDLIESITNGETTLHKGALFGLAVTDYYYHSKNNIAIRQLYRKRIELKRIKDFLERACSIDELVLLVFTELGLK